MIPDDLDFELPDALIARAPTEQRSASRLLVLGASGAEDAQMQRLPELLNPGDLLVFNDTRVVPARLFGTKASGGRIEVMLERVTGEQEAVVQIRASHAPKPGARIAIHDDDGVVAGNATVNARDGRFFAVTFDRPVQVITDAAGHMPLPPYIDRADTPTDRERYQTVYARESGAVAAPTAGLHFDDELLQALKLRGVTSAFVTLHVAGGTFLPLTQAQLDTDTLHAERYTVSEAVCDAVRATQASGGRVVCVGTTSLRALESAARDGQLSPGSADTELFIRPGFEFKVADGLLTNFHLPRSSLLMLVSAFAGHAAVMRAYAHAIEQRYRFFSYGDAMLCLHREARQ
ncbi:MAG: tRNA preQ1(34) S-adenosylmethionine ribosyltransferase-isomerase QueA [Pseudomonadota bacterium]